MGGPGWPFLYSISVNCYWLHVKVWNPNIEQGYWQGCNFTDCSGFTSTYSRNKFELYFLKLFCERGKNVKVSRKARTNQILLLIWNMTVNKPKIRSRSKILKQNRSQPLGFEAGQTSFILSNNTLALAFTLSGFLRSVKMVRSFPGCRGI